MSIDVLVVQHGEKVRSAGDPGLTDAGHHQAATVARWLAENHPHVDAIVSSPLRRARETAAPTATALGLPVGIDARFRERMNWNHEASVSLDEFLAEWQRATDDRHHQPIVGDSSHAAAARFIDGLRDLEQRVDGGLVAVVAHGGVTVDTLRTVAGDAAVNSARRDLIPDGVPCGAITRLRVTDGAVTVIDYPSTAHLARATPHHPA